MCVLLRLHRILLVQLADIGAGDKCFLPRAGQDGNAGCAIIANGFEGRAQFLHGRHVQRIELVRTIDRHVCDRVLLVEQDVLEISHE